jgi:hypothetical protein
VQGSQGRHSSGSKILYDEDVIEELVVCGHALRNVPGRNVLAVRGEFESVEGLLELGKFREDGSEAGHSQRHVAIRLGLGEVEGGVVAGLVPDDSGKDVDHLGSGLGLLGEAVDVSVLLVRALLEEQGKFLVSLDLVVGIVESFDDLCHVLPECVLKHLSVIQVPVKKGVLEVGVEASRLQLLMEPNLVPNVVLLSVVLSNNGRPDLSVHCEEALQQVVHWSNQGLSGKRVDGDQVDKVSSEEIADDWVTVSLLV